MKSAFLEGDEKILEEDASDYQLIRPVMFTNAMFREGYKIRLWNA